MSVFTIPLRIFHTYISKEYSFTQAACSVSLGFGEDSLHASSVLVMPMVSSKITGFRGGGLDRAKLLSARGSGWNKFTVDKDSETILETTAMLPQVINLD